MRKGPPRGAVSVGWPPLGAGLFRRPRLDRVAAVSGPYPRAALRHPSEWASDHSRSPGERSGEEPGSTIMRSGDKKHTWDVFVSHNKQQKPWVRQVVDQWRSLGLRVFFDEDSIEPGEPNDE